MQTWDYANDGAYFITICTKNREHYFGEIENGKMQLSPIGAIADVLWYEIKNHAKNIELGEFVVMPNHVHGVLILAGNDEFLVDNTGGDNAIRGDNVIRGDNAIRRRDNACVVPTNAIPTIAIPPVTIPPVTIPPTAIPTIAIPPNVSPTGINPMDVVPTEKTIGQNRFQNQGKNSISSIVGGYKSAVTKHAHRLGFSFGWQTRFHDHIIRDEKSFHNISNYIINNPVNWKEDKFNNGDNVNTM
ncbi:MAG: transposase [Bacteroidetes bacterium]|nr:transposase [Bacteroidota bacterium]